MGVFNLALQGVNATGIAWTPGGAAYLADDDPGPRVVKGRIIDKDDAYSEVLTTITVDNVSPTVFQSLLVGKVPAENDTERMNV